MSLVRVVARPMLAAVFVVGGVDTLRNPAPRVRAADDVGPAIARRLGLPEDPELLVRLNAAVHVGAGVLLGAGKLRRPAAFALALSLVPTTWAGHAFWEADDPAEQARQRTHFLKNVAILGGLLLEVVDTGGAPSVGWRSRRAAERAAESVASGAAAATAGGRRARKKAARRAGEAATAAKAAAAKKAAKAAKEAARRQAADRAKQAAKAAAAVKAANSANAAKAAKAAKAVQVATASQAATAVHAARAAGDVARSHLPV